MRFFSRLSWFATFLIPALAAIAVALWGLNSTLPRIYFVAAFLFILIILPGVFILLKILGTPIHEEEIVLLAAGSGDRVKVLRPDGHQDIVSDIGLKKALLAGELPSGTRLRLLRRGDIVVRWEPIP
ncbi:MAG: hypothetical protein QME76_05490 [Bacillota bacterium]|nr:hypothetical protein [Bacillota bacterium]